MEDIGIVYEEWTNHLNDCNFKLLTLEFLTESNSTVDLFFRL